MICPYNQNFEITRHINIIDKELLLRGSIQTTQWENKKCEEENCAVWRDGKCCYNSTK